MELKQNLIHRNYHKCEADSQVTIGDDYSVPEGKPDVGEILQKKAELLIEEVPMEKGKIRIKGKLKVWVLYQTERSKDPLDCLEMEFPFDEILYMEGAVTGDNLKLDWEIEELQISIVHPGKLSIRSRVTFKGIIVGKEGAYLTETIEETPGNCILCEKMELTVPVLDRKESFRMRDEILLPVNKPNIQRILWKDLQVRGMDVRILEGRISVKGEALIFVLYQTEEEPSQIQWLEQSIPFHGTVEAEDLTQEMYGILEPQISQQVIELKPDYDGEMRMLQIELVLDIPMRLYQEQSFHVLKDAYSTREQLQMEKQQLCLQKLRMCNQVNFRVNGQGEVQENVQILQLLGHQAELRAKSRRVTEEGILCEGILEVRILYVNADDRNPFGCVNIQLPYSQQIEIPEMKNEDRWSIFEALEQIYLSMPDSDRIEVRAALNITACVLEQYCVDQITAVTAEPYDLEAYKKSPGMKIHFVQPKETLWTIAKENKVTMENIKTMNELQTEELVPGQKLLLLKPVREG